MDIVLGFVFRVTHDGLDHSVLVDCLEFMLYSYLKADSPALHHIIFNSHPDT